MTTHDDNDNDNRPPVSRKASNTVIPQEYPMYAIHVSTFLQQRGKPRPHQDLLADGLLKEITDDDRHTITTSPIIFLSHQWLSASSPDEELQQIGVLQRVLRRMAQGNVPDVEIHYAQQLLYPGRGGILGKEEMRILGANSYIWYDFYSVPQPGCEDESITTNEADDEAKEEESDDDGNPKTTGSSSLHTTKKGIHGTDHRIHGTKGALLEGLLGAVRSIPAYMEQSSHMVVLAPTCAHADSNDDDHYVCDLRSWRRRGWCRLELQCRLFSSRGDGQVIVVQSAEATPWLVHPLEASRMCVGQGEFSVESDRAVTGQVLDKLIRGKAENLARKGEAFEHNYLNVIVPQILDGCGAGSTSGDRDKGNESYIMVDFMLLPDKESEKAGWTHLRFAVIRRDAARVADILAQPDGVDVESPLTRDYPEQFRKKAMTVLHDAMFSSTPEIVALLLDVGHARHDAVDGQGQDALIWAVTGGNVEAVRYWLERFPDWDLTVGDIMVGSNALNWCFYYLDETKGLPIAHMLLNAGSDPHFVANAGVTILHLAAGSDDSSLGMVKLALEYQDVNHQLRPKSGFWKAFYWAFKLALRFGARKKFVQVFGHSPGMTALHNAAMFGNSPVVGLLLDSGADKTIRTDLGLTALDISHIFGPFPVIEELLG